MKNHYQWVKGDGVATLQREGRPDDSYTKEELEYTINMVKKSWRFYPSHAAWLFTLNQLTEGLECFKETK